MSGDGRPRLDHELAGTNISRVDGAHSYGGAFCGCFSITIEMLRLTPGRFRGPYGRLGMQDKHPLRCTLSPPPNYYFIFLFFGNTWLYAHSCTLTPGRLEGPYMMLELEPKSARCKANVLSAVLSLWSALTCFQLIVIIWGWVVGPHPEALRAYSRLWLWDKSRGAVEWGSDRVLGMASALAECKASKRPVGCPTALAPW